MHVAASHEVAKSLPASEGVSRTGGFASHEATKSRSHEETSFGLVFETSVTPDN
jgi:hypothetical protein